MKLTEAKLKTMIVEAMSEVGEYPNSQEYYNGIKELLRTENTYEMADTLFDQVKDQMDRNKHRLWMSNLLKPFHIAKEIKKAQEDGNVDVANEKRKQLFDEISLMERAEVDPDIIEATRKVTSKLIQRKVPPRPRRRPKKR